MSNEVAPHCHHPESMASDLCPHCKARTGGPRAANMRRFHHELVVSKSHGLACVCTYEAPVYTCGNCHHVWTDMQKDLAETRARLDFLEKDVMDRVRRELGYTKEEDR